ncbi:glycosyltransferase [Streptococcus porcinus]|uniref:Glycosyltransferase, group 1 family protein n=1 Tax=Streptococcus porcinus str. Jelinkova 176 TaxID=873448 RepID=A0ABP2KWQ8_STRPO|nr:glycosyltransferase [Streptococcus porcinus]EGJ26513.1 glycosyltransferase, group 1 family protein [Streptococcus porcinus str. Jelinkova 176]SQG43874.1 UDP-D-galactose:(glucosyl)lipopolysaccharide-1,6-D-galactosyltransferase [Streptococcus porcinus]
MTNNKYLYIGGFELPDKNAAAHRVLSNGKALKETGLEVIFLGVNRTLGESDILNTVKEVEGFKTYELRYPEGIFQWFNYLTSIESIVKVIYTNNIQNIICYNLPSIVLKRLMMFCRVNNFKIYGDVTEWYSTKGRSLPNKILKGLDTFYRMAILHKKLDGLIVISTFLEKYYAEYVNNIICIPVLSDLEDVKWVNNYQKSQEILQLVYAGNPGKKENLDLMVSSLEYITRKVKLDVIGINEEEFLNTYPRFKKSKITSKVSFHGRLSHEVSLDFVKKANYTFFLRDNDIVSNAGFPTKLVESVSCGTPVITNKTSNISDYINSQINGVLLDALDPPYVAEVIDNLKLEMKVEKETFDYRQFSKQPVFKSFFSNS